MEKSSTNCAVKAVGPGRAHRIQDWVLRVATILAAINLYHSVQSSSRTRLESSYHDNPPTVSGEAFDWLKVLPQEHLAYHPCFGGFQCARVSVPLNWNDSSDPARAAIALVKLPAKVPVADPRYGGAIVLNPGGPANSGVAQLVRQGRYIQALADAPRSHLAADGLSDGKYFDIIGFDPRGVNNTAPHIKCFPNSQAEMSFYASQPGDEMLAVSDSHFDLAWAQYRAVGETCALQHGDEPNMAAYANTAQVVEDIVAIIERHGQWREAETKKLLDSRHGARLSATEREEVERRNRWQKNDEKLNYWGISYGSLLGQTFATMHPDRVSRVIIDGIVDPDDYYSADWLKNLQDTDQILLRWGEYCNQAPEACPFADADSSAEAVAARILLLIESLLKDPIAVPGNAEHGPTVIASRDITELVTAALYQPRIVESTFDMLKDLEARDGTRLAALKAARDLSPVSISDDCLRDGLYSEACVRDSGPLPPYGGIACADGPDLRNTTKAEFRQYFEQIRNQSAVIGAPWSGHRMICINWGVRPAWKFNGPWTANTSHPLLILGNSHDPVTPLRNAHRVSTLFPGSVVLHQNTEGHCTHAAPSLCTGKAFRKYFQDGTLPAPGTVCEPEHRPWIGCVNPNGCDNRSAEDQALWETMASLTGAYR